MSPRGVHNWGDHDSPRPRGRINLPQPQGTTGVVDTITTRMSDGTAPALVPPTQPTAAQTGGGLVATSTQVVPSGHDGWPQQLQPPFLPSSVGILPPSVQQLPRTVTITARQFNVRRLHNPMEVPLGLEAVNLYERRLDRNGREEAFYTTYRVGSPAGYGITQLCPLDASLPCVTTMHDVHIALTPRPDGSQASWLWDSSAPGPSGSQGGQ